MISVGDSTSGLCQNDFMERGEGLVKTAGLARRAGDWLGRLGTGFLDQLYPPTCLACEAPLLGADALCGACFARLKPITAPFCPRLGLPFAYSLGPDALSAEAIADPPPFSRARSALVYNDLARQVVSRLKYGDRPELARFCARLMAGAGRDLWGEDIVLVPVPLHFGRHLMRRYNQSAELARALGRVLNAPVDVDLLRRDRPTRQQVGLGASQRRRNVMGAFRAHPDALARLAGRRVVLVDDVITTGATVKTATHALKRGGAREIDVISFARVVISDALPI